MLTKAAFVLITIYCEPTHYTKRERQRLQYVSIIHYYFYQITTDLVKYLTRSCVKYWPSHTPLNIQPCDNFYLKLTLNLSNKNQLLVTNKSFGKKNHFWKLWCSYFLVVGRDFVSVQPKLSLITSESLTDLNEVKPHLEALKRPYILICSKLVQMQTFML